MSAMNAEKFERLCDDVWRDRADIMMARGQLRGEAALLRTVYCRLGATVGTPGGDIEAGDPGHMLLIYKRLIGGTLTKYPHPHFDSSPFLTKLVRQYMYEVGQN